jgi:hypothetical protein
VTSEKEEEEEEEEEEYEEDEADGRWYICFTQPMIYVIVDSSKSSIAVLSHTVYDIQYIIYLS